jgi:serine/threonine protein kinase
LSPLDSDLSLPPRFPRRFGSRFILLKELGKGGMGHVFLALTGQAGVQRMCALKVLKDLRANRDAEELTQRFLDEAKVVTKLSHENLVYVFDFGIEERQGFLAMEHVQGKSLTEVWNRCALRRDGFAVGLTLHFIAELVTGLAYATRIDDLGLVHRDISPSNVMITYTGGLKLIDFGLAKWNDKVVQTATGVQWGKTSYMSPEQYTGKPVDHRSDLYSAGVILWELLTGRQLFPPTESRLPSTPIQPPSKFSQSVSPGLDHVVCKALAVNPADRYQDGDEMASALLAQLPPEGGGKPQAARFMTRLFETEIRAEQEEHRQLIAAASELDPASPAVSATVSGALDDGQTTLDPDPDGLVGQTLSDRYFIRKLVGEGAMGRVYEGHHTGIGKRVAIKISHQAERRKTEIARRFQREALAPAQIGHPNVADVTDCGTTPSGEFYFVMEYIDGVGLDAILRRDGKLSLERSLMIAVQVCRALEAAHNAGIIHRDLKPSNIMLVRTPEDDCDLVKVLDFGVAKFLRETGDGNLTLTDATVGTPRYMAPEQIRGGGKVDFRADIYAMGGILYAMLAGGKIPVDGTSVEDIWQRKLTQDPTPLRLYRSDLSDDLEELILRCLARDPGQRPASAEELKKQLVAHLENCRATGESILAMKAPSQTAVVSERARKRQIKLGIILGIGTALVIILLGALLLRAPHSAPTTALLPPAVPAPSAPAPSAPAPSAPAPSAPTVALAAPPAPAPPPPAAVPAARPMAPAPSPVAPPLPATEKAPLDARRATPTPEEIASHDQATQALVTRAAESFSNGNLELARAAATKAVAEARHASPETRVRAYLILAKVQLAAKEFPAAQKTFERILAIDPANPVALKGKERARGKANN